MVVDTGDVEGRLFDVDGCSVVTVTIELVQVIFGG